MKGGGEGFNAHSRCPGGRNATKRLGEKRDQQTKSDEDEQTQGFGLIPYPFSKRGQQGQLDGRRTGSRAGQRRYAAKASTD